MPSHGRISQTALTQGTQTDPGVRVKLRQLTVMLRLSAQHIGQRQLGRRVFTANVRYWCTLRNSR